MDFGEALKTLLSLTILVFVLQGMKKVIAYFAGKYGATGISTFMVG